MRASVSVLKLRDRESLGGALARPLLRTARDVALLAAAWCLLGLCFTGDAHADDCRGLADKNDCPQAMAAESARGLGLSTGGRATAISSSALAYSPGALAVGNLYHIEGAVDYMAELKTVALGGAVVDSSTSKIGAGIGLRGFLSGDQGYDGLDGRLGIALAISDAFSVGVLGRYIDLSRDVPDGDELVEDELAQGFTMDASVRVMPAAGFQLDLGAQNFIDLDTPFVPIMLTGALAISVADALSIGADLLTDMTSFRSPALTLGAGLEYLAGNTVPLRIGYGVDLAREVHSIGAGVGYTDERVGLDLGLRQELKGGDATRIMGAVRYYVN